VNWQNNLLRLEQLKKKESATIARSIKARAAHETAVARGIIAQRELRLAKLPKEQLPETVDVIARERAEQRRAAKQ
jgi:hypothetical protein